MKAAEYTLTHAQEKSLSSPQTLPAGKVARNTIILMLGQFVAQASMAIIGIFVARTFGQHGYGQYTLAFSYVSLFGLIFSLGGDSIVIRNVARDPDRAWAMLTAAFRLRVIGFILAVALIALTTSLTSYDDHQQKLIILTAIGIGISIVGDLPNAIFHSLQRMDIDMLTRAGEDVLIFMLVFIFLNVSHSIEAILAAVLVGGMIGAVISYAILPMLIGKLDVAPLRSSFDLFKQTLPVALSAYFITVYQQLPTIILSWVRPQTDVGLYNAANGLIAPFALLPFAFGNAILPALSKTFHTLDKSTLRTHLYIFAVLCAISFPISIGLSLLADPIVLLLYGPAFAPTAAVLRIVSATIPMMFFSTYLNYVFVAFHNERSLLFVVVSNLVATIGIGVLMIPVYGYFGAAITRLLGPGVGLMIMFYILFTRMRKKSQA